MRVVTLNTWKNEGNLPRRLVAMIDGLRLMRPDVVLLQEVFRTMDDAVHVGRMLAEALELTLAYAPARRKPRRWQNADVMSESGLGVLVRGRIDAQKRLRLPSDAHGGERVALIVQAVIGGWLVSAASIHLSHVRGDDRRRREQLSCVIADAFWREPADLRVIGGDCNATRDALALDQMVADRALSVRVMATDGPIASTHPFPPRPGRSGRVIDQLFVLTLRGEPIPRISPARLALHEPINGVQPSDHAAVWANIDLPWIPPESCACTA